MKDNIIFILTSLLFFFFIPYPTNAQIVINEYMPQANPEWVELYNPTNTTITLNNWQIDDQPEASQPETFNASLLPYSYYMIILSKNIFNNNSPDQVRLLDQNGNEIDVASYDHIPQNSFSYSRCPNGSGEFIETPASKGKSNICPSITPTPYSSPSPTPSLTSTPTPLPTSSPTPTNTPTPLPTPSPTPSFTPTPTPSSTSSEANFVLELSEVYPNPYSSENEWVEIYNPNEFEVQTINWQIDDKEGASSPISFSAAIPAKGYTVIEIPKAMLNNSGDDVRLLDPTGKEVNKFSYTLSQKGFSFAKDSSGKWCLQEPTKGKNNLTCKSDPKEESNSSSEKNSSTLPSPTSFPKTSIISYSNQNTTIYFNTYQPPSVLGSTTIKKSVPAKLKIKNQSKLLSASFFTFNLNLLTLLYLYFKILKLL